jgi:cytochrome c oxidase subunit 2
VSRDSGVRMLLDVPLRLPTFQDTASPIAEGIVDLHHIIFTYLLVILFTVIPMFYTIVKTSSYKWNTPDTTHIMTFSKDYLLVNHLVHGEILEIIWTIVPSLILMMIAIPSFALLYSIDEIIDPKYTIKVIAQQWYWSYETPDSVKLESYMLPTTDLSSGGLRLLDVDNMLSCPINTHIRFLITSLDVLHSFSIPSLGLKVDAVPGRLNQLSTLINREGIFYGQCSELRGANHGFMPIKIIGVDPKLVNTSKG